LDPIPWWHANDAKLTQIYRRAVLPLGTTFVFIILMRLHFGI
jgi:hypothetical protein